MALYPVGSTTNIDPPPSRFQTIKTVAVATTSVMLLAVNANRKGFSVFNNSSRRISLGSTNTIGPTSGFFAIIPANTIYEWSGASIYTGELWAVADGVDGTCQVSELTP